MTDPRLPVSEEEVEAAYNANSYPLRKEWLRQGLTAAHAVLVPRIERALENVLIYFPVRGDDVIDNGDTRRFLSSNVIRRLRAAFWRTMEEK